MNWYEQKQEAKRERLEAAADRAQSRAEAADARGRAILDPIPSGQPILVGHHSEKRHRRAIERAHNAFRAAHAESDRAAELRGRASSVGEGGISSDDPDAIAKLREQLAGLEAKRTLYKTINAAHKRFLKDPASLEKSGLPEQARSIVRDYKPPYSWEPHPIAPYQLTNLGANIRRIEKRIEDLEASAADTEARPDVVFDGFRIEDAPEDNRIRIRFDARQPREVVAVLKRWGFRWSPTVEAWQRHRNNAGRYAAETAAKDIEALKAAGATGHETP